MIIWNSSFFPALYSSCSELNHKKIQYCSSSGLSRLCSSFLDLSNFLISGKSSNEKKPETRNSWNEEFPETRKILKRGISWNEEILSHHRLLCFITNIKRNTAGLSARALPDFWWGGKKEAGEWTGHGLRTLLGSLANKYALFFFKSRLSSMTDLNNFKNHICWSFKVFESMTWIRWSMLMRTRR